MLELGFELLTDENLEEIKKRIDSDENPKNIKIDLGLKIVSIFNGEDGAKKALENWETQFSKKEIPDNLEEFSFETGIKIIDILKDVNFVKSNGEARRKIDEGAVQIDGEKITDYFTEILGGEKILKLGKKMAKLILK